MTRAMAVPANDRLPERSAPPARSRSIPKMEIHEGDCRDVLASIPDNTVHLVVTDPPYFLDGLDGDWSKGKENAARATGAIGGLPVGMKFDPAQGVKLQKFMEPIAVELLRVLRPGGFMLMFAAPRLYHRAAIAVEDAGFEIRDSYVWHFTKRAQFKAFTMDHFIQKRDDMTEREKTRAINKTGGRRTPQLRPQFESILCAQKPKDGTFVNNWLLHQTGLIDSSQTLNGHVPETVMTVEKPDRERCNGHLTPKPVKLCEHLIRVFSTKGQTVLDPFAGSGTTCIAAQRTGRHGIGIEINPSYVEIINKRLEEEK